MDLGIKGRAVALVGPDDDVAHACRQMFGREGAEVVDSARDDVDIVVARGVPRPGSEVLAWQSADELVDAWQPVVDAVTVYRRALPAMAARSWGRFIWVGTAASRSLDADDDEVDGVVTLAMRAASKVVASEAGVDGITANAVLHGGNARADDVASTVGFLCSEGAGYVTGVTITVDGGAGSAVY